MNTAEHRTPASDAIDVEENWAGYINQRLNHAEALLADIAGTIELVEPRSREHVADLLDSTIESLERHRRRFGPHEPEDDPDNPPF